MARYLVIGTCRVNGVAHGGVVDLDENAVNVAVLAAGGHIAPAPDDAVDGDPDAAPALATATADTGTVDAEEATGDDAEPATAAKAASKRRR